MKVNTDYVVESFSLNRDPQHITMRCKSRSIINRFTSKLLNLFPQSKITITSEKLYKETHGDIPKNAAKEVLKVLNT